MAHRSDYPLPRPLAEEVLALALFKTYPSRPVGQAKYEARRYAGVILTALEETSVTLTKWPEVVRIGRFKEIAQPVSNPKTRLFARQAFQGERDPVSGIVAAVRVTVEHHPEWSLADVLRHTAKFVVP